MTKQTRESTYRVRTGALLLAAPLALTGCSGTDTVSFPNGLGPDDASTASAAPAPGTPVPRPGSPDAAAPQPRQDAGPRPGTGPSGPDASIALDAAADAIGAGSDPDAAAANLAQQLGALTATCKTVASQGKYASSFAGGPASVDVCALNGAFFWKTGMSIDCDGQVSAACNRMTDPSFSGQTSFTQSNGQPLDAQTLPYVVLPLPSGVWSYITADVHPGALAAVLYQGKLVFGVFGDEGPAASIGGASYAMAQRLGIPSSPTKGGAPSGLTYIVFTGASGVVAPLEDPQAAATLGAVLGPVLVNAN
jgi:hypothetical protein